MMELCLQFGWGMMEHCRSLVAAWGGGTAVLSPRDLDGEQLARLAAQLQKLPGGNVLLDPQLYSPRADHERLCSHDYWPKEYESNVFWQGPSLTTLIEKLAALNRSLGAVGFVLPGILATTINDDWLETQRAILEESSRRVTDMPLIGTIALSDDAGRDQAQVVNLLERLTSWESAAGFYLVCEHPRGEYLVDDANWLANILDIVAGIRLAGKFAIVGYCNHQMLVAAAVKANAICSGTWMNVRSFPPDKFRSIYDEEIKQRATWYYCPQALSEYKLPFLDIAYRLKLLNDMAPLPDMDGGYAGSLFGSVQPSLVGFSEQTAFRHYLHCLRQQALRSERSSFDETVTELEESLNVAERVLGRLRATGVSGQRRDFAEIVDVNRAALGIIKSTRGPMLRRRWSSIPSGVPWSPTQ